MLRSRFFPITCSCLKTADQLFEIVKDISVYASQTVGVGVSEKVFENVIVNELYYRRIPCLRQVKCYKTVDNNIYETGILDLEVDSKLLLELKVNYPNITSDHTLQAKRYLSAAREKYPDEILIAAVILFTKQGSVKFWKCRSVPTSSRFDIDVSDSSRDDADLRLENTAQ